MHRWLLFCYLAALIGTTATSCTEADPAPLYMDIRYQVRCVFCEPRAPDDPVRDIELLDGEQGYTVECHASQRDGDRLLSFSTEFDAPSTSDDFAISVLQLNLDKNDPGSDCRVRVTEGSNSYEGDCTKGDPDEDAPCSVDMDVEGGVVSGTILCADMPNRSMGTIRRHLVAPGSEDEGARFELHGCTGI